MTYHFTDVDGDELIIEPIGRYGRPAISLRTKRSNSHEGAAVHLTADQMEGVITSMRATLRQALTGQAQRPEAPAVCWSIDYHRLNPARLNAAVCICGLGPDHVVHNEPPHRFNGRTKPGMTPVHGVCTDCHHHQTAACHTTDN